jgi:hypothetical protein
MARPFKKLKPVNPRKSSATVLNKTAAAKRWGCSVDTIERGIKRGLIRTVRLNKRGRARHLEGGPEQRVNAVRAQGE